MSNTGNCIAQPPSEHERRSGLIDYATDILAEDGGDGVSVTLLDTVLRTVNSDDRLVVTMPTDEPDAKYMAFGAMVLDHSHPFDYYVEPVDSKRPELGYKKRLKFNAATYQREGYPTDLTASREITLSTDPEDDRPTFMGAGLRYEYVALTHAQSPARVAVGPFEVATLFSELSTRFEDRNRRVKLVGALFHIALLAQGLHERVPVVPLLRPEIHAAAGEYERRARLFESLTRLSAGFKEYRENSERHDGATNWIWDRPLQLPAAGMMDQAERGVQFLNREARHSRQAVDEGLAALRALEGNAE